VADYLALPDGVRAELVGGELYVTPSPSLDHQEVVLTLGSALRDHARERGAGTVAIAPVDVHLPSGDVVQPDVLFVAREGSARLRTWVYGVPDLLIEVVSPTHAERDRDLKRRLYERNGVPEYWIVDPQEGSIEVLRHDGNRLQPSGYLEGDATLETPTFPDLALDLRDVFTR